MRLTYFVNAMIQMQGRGTSVLCDPWITFDAQSTSGLYNFPPINLSREDVRQLNPDYIYITHTHADHFDPETLSCFDKDTPFLVADFENNFTLRNLRKEGFTDIRIVDPDKGLALNGDDHVWIQPSAIYPEVDSIAAFRIDGITVFNANDNPYDHGQTEHFKRVLGDVDICCVPFAFQGPYPAFYENLSPVEKQAKAREKQIRGYKHVAGYAGTLQPKRLFAFAAGALYGGAKALLHPYYGVGSVEEAIAFAQESADFEPVMLSGGMSIDLPDGRVAGLYKPATHATETAYIEMVSRKPGPFDQGGEFWIAEEARIDLAPMLAKARARQDEWAERTGRWSDMPFYIDVGLPNLYRMQLGDSEVRRISEAEISDPAYEIFRIPYPLLVGLLTKHYNWSNVKTQFVSFYRKPDRFDQDLHILMSYLQL